MYSPPLRNHYISILSSILRQDEEFKSSRLLQAYVTFSAMISTGLTPPEAYSLICVKYSNYKKALLRISKQQGKTISYEEIKKYIDISFQDFMKYVTPDIVCDPIALMTYYHSYISQYELDHVQLLHHIIAIKLNSYQTITYGSNTKSSSDLKDDPLTLIYNQYRENETNPLPISVLIHMNFHQN